MVSTNRSRNKNALKRPRLRDNDDETTVLDIKRRPAPRVSIGDVPKIYLSPSTPIISAVKRTKKVLAKQVIPTRKHSHVELYAMGKAINNILQVAAMLKKEYKVEVLTGSVSVYDEATTDEDVKYQERMVSRVQINVYKPS